MNDEQFRKSCCTLLKKASAAINALLIENDRLIKLAGEKTQIEKMAEDISKIKNVSNELAVKIATDVINKGGTITDALSCLATDFGDDGIGILVEGSASQRIMQGTENNGFLAAIRSAGNIKFNN